MTKKFLLFTLALATCLAFVACGGDDEPSSGGSGSGSSGSGGSGSGGGNTSVNITIDNTTPVSSKNRIIYEMNVGAFTTAGTLKAAQDKLGDLKTLGVDIVWLMPIYPRGGGINSPYAATDFKAVNPSYGTIADLKNFVAKAHTLNMEVWLDWVPNHTATNAKWISEHPEYYTRNGGAFVHPNGYGDVYQLDYNSAALRNAMNDCLKFWIDQADVDGYRCDFVSSKAIPTSYWQDAIPLIKNYKSGKTISFLAEADVVQGETRLANVGFDYDYAWNFQGGQLAGFGPNGTSGETMRSRCEAFVNVSKNAHLGRMVYLTNHDVSYNDGGKNLITLYGANRHALTVLEFTIYGMPLLYNGQEIGTAQTLNYFTDEKVNWSSVDNKMKNTIRTLAALRHTQAALADNVEPYFHSSDNAGVLAYTKTSGSSRVLVVINFSASDVTVKLNGVSAGNYAKWLSSKDISAGVASKAEVVSMTSTPAITLDAKGYAVYVKQ
ncbi:MAG: alpha-glucosidase C-terminal domain-containing protein [Muribaculaceae bacterium]|nr:alpha-glucosidase C-terminal domain-containing protein [Muribaculaceae bacterium]